MAFPPRSRRGWLAAILAAAALGPLAAQEPPTDEVPLGIVIHDHASVGLVLVPVVLRKGERLLGTLSQNAFRLYVDEQLVPIESFERGAAAPLSLIVLQDLSGSMEHEGKLEASRQAIRYFLDRTQSRDEMALATFAGASTRVEVPFTSNLEVLRESLGVWEGYGTTALYDAVAWLPHLSLAGNRIKRAAVLITDGVDNASEIPPEEAREIVRRAELPVYVLGLRSHDAVVGEDTFRYADLLAILAQATGGRYYSVAQSSDVQEACAAILSELRQQYVLGFSESGVGPRAYRPIRVDVKGRGRKARILHRRGYEGTAPAALE